MASVRGLRAALIRQASQTRTTSESSLLSSPTSEAPPKAACSLTAPPSAPASINRHPRTAPAGSSTCRVLSGPSTWTEMRIAHGSHHRPCSQEAQSCLLAYHSSHLTISDDFRPLFISTIPYLDRSHGVLGFWGSASLTSYYQDIVDYREHQKT